MAKKALIIGAGPAGLTAAYELLKKGEDIDVTIFEETEEFEETEDADCINIFEDSGDGEIAFSSPEDGLSYEPGGFVATA